MRLDSGGGRTRTCAGKVAVSREKDCRARPSPSCPPSGRATAASPLRRLYLFSPPTFSVAGKSEAVVKLTTA